MNERERDRERGDLRELKRSEDERDELQFMINRVDQSVRPDFKTAVIFLGRLVWLAHRFLTCRPNFMY